MASRDGQPSGAKGNEDSAVRHNAPSTGSDGETIPASAEAVIRLGYPPDLVLSVHERLANRQTSHGHTQGRSPAPGSGSPAMTGSCPSRDVSAAALLAAVDDANLRPSSVDPSSATTVVGASCPGRSSLSETTDTGRFCPPPSEAFQPSTQTSSLSSSAASLQEDSAQSPERGSPSASHDPAPESTTESRHRKEHAPDDVTARERRCQLERLRALRQENRRLKARQSCRRCRRRPSALTLLPCGHFAFCEQCGASYDVCPLCNRTVLADVKTFLS